MQDDDADGEDGSDDGSASSAGAGVRFVKLGLMHGVYVTSDPRRRVVANTRKPLEAAAKKLRELADSGRTLDDDEFGPLSHPEFLIARMAGGLEIWFSPEENRFFVYRRDRRIGSGFPTFLAARKEVAHMLAMEEPASGPPPAGPRRTFNR